MCASSVGASSFGYIAKPALPLPHSPTLSLNGTLYDCLNIKVFKKDAEKCNSRSFQSTHCAANCLKDQSSLTAMQNE